MSDFTQPVRDRGLANARHALATAPKDGDDYGFTYQTTAQGHHGSHRGEIPLDRTTAANALASNLDLLAALERQLNAPSYIAWLEERARLTQAVAYNMAKWGDGGTWKEYRDNLYATLSIAKRGELEASAPLVTDSKGVSKPRPVTEPMVDAAVRTDEQYVAFVDEATKQQADLAVKQNALDDITQLLYWASALVRKTGALDPQGVGV